MKKTVAALSILIVILSTVLAFMLVGMVKMYDKTDYVDKENTMSEVSSVPDVVTESEEADSSQELTFIESLAFTREHNMANDDTLLFELPLNGAMGFSSGNTKIYPDKTLSGTSSSFLNAGQAFVIIEEIDGTVWKIISKDGNEGYISNKNCFINLPDIIPSIVYKITNSSSSIFLSSGKELPEVTGEKLFDFYLYNERYGEEEYIAPVMYTMAKKIYTAQISALNEGNTLVIYETYRPYDAQMKVAKSLKSLSNSDKEVRAGLSKSPWSLNWFIATQLSTHQKGCAIDVSLAMVNKAEVKDCGSFKYLDIKDYTEYEMQTAMHELSVNAVALKRPVAGNSKDAWKNVENSPLMTEGSVILKRYCTETGMSPLASEWWHFNDLDAVAELGRNYRLDYNFSVSISRPVGDVE